MTTLYQQNLLIAIVVINRCIVAEWLMKLVNKVQCNENIGRYYLATLPHLDYLRSHYVLSKSKLYEYRIQDVELEFQIQHERPSNKLLLLQIYYLDTIKTYFTGKDAERAAHFVKELRKLETDILKLNDRIEKLQQIICLLHEELK